MGGKVYRVPGFLATSLDKKTALDFLNRVSRSPSRVLWCIKVDPRGREELERRVKHASFILNTQIPGESEFLYVPYSAFKIVSVEWDSKVERYSQMLVTHKIILEAVLDNRDDQTAPEDSPLAPWY